MDIYYQKDFTNFVMAGLYLYTALFLLVAGGTYGFPQVKDQFPDSEGNFILFPVFGFTLTDTFFSSNAYRVSFLWKIRY